MPLEGEADVLEAADIPSTSNTQPEHSQTLMIDDEVATDKENNPTTCTFSEIVNARVEPVTRGSKRKRTISHVKVLTSSPYMNSLASVKNCTSKSDRCSTSKGKSVTKSL